MAKLLDSGVDDPFGKMAVVETRETSFLFLELSCLESHKIQKSKGTRRGRRLGESRTRNGSTDLRIQFTNPVDAHLFYHMFEHDLCLGSGKEHVYDFLLCDEGN